MIYAISRLGTDMTRSTLRFCSFCGASFKGENILCSSCGGNTYTKPAHSGPALLVITSVIAENRLLLMKRASEPYAGFWAPPGGFVENGESLETAAARELEEEVGVRISTELLIPQGLVSLPSLNQVHVIFLATLHRTVKLHPKMPEALDAAWFPESDFPLERIWEPANNFDFRRIFERARTGRVDFYQQSDSSFRVFSNEVGVAYLWRR